MAILSGKTFVAPASSKTVTGKSTIATVKKVKSFVEPGPVRAGLTNDQEKQLLRIQTAARSFSPPQGHFEWGKRLYKVGLEYEVCRNDKMRMGWLTAKQKGA